VFEFEFEFELEDRRDDEVIVSSCSFIGLILPEFPPPPPPPDENEDLDDDRL
jgi:hypothetical protein